MYFYQMSPCFAPRGGSCDTVLKSYAVVFRNTLPASSGRSLRVSVQQLCRLVPYVSVCSSVCRMTVRNM